MASSDTARTLWDTIRDMIHRLSRAKLGDEQVVELVIRNLKNTASLISRVHDPPLITKDYMYSIVELAKSVSIVKWYIDNVVEGRSELLERLRDETNRMFSIARRVYSSYRNRLRALAFNVLTPILIASLDLVIIGFSNIVYPLIILLLASLTIILLPLNTRMHGIFLVLLSFTSMFMVLRLIREPTTWIVVFLYSIIGVISGFTAYYASAVKENLSRLVQDILGSRPTIPLEEYAPSRQAEKPAEKISNLYKLLLEKYEELYGFRGREILEYRIAMMERAGYSRSRALEELARELGLKTDRNKT